ncbi:hypothetical protein GLAREA_09866 [Glarea lozoyensis ATCC 20868]|uniref:Uncharacterized protein n=1 Tax=Glarea lozoyensis (strain ATCC 20868 / MF5171) TaxID=1116229 RepID=S3CSW4_GLAL2|nr:uncharacterized protein GLAREA_09866 [Glarea lozoyensis ATCC 20868]EPE28745.1 hypothetical protein GLAREA_09866 [Glarea lozoyensis ATCC 20868]
MQYSFALAALLSATAVVALPLNINLGAYSPALVVGDGEISFGGGEAGAEALFNTLSGASASGSGAAEGLTRSESEPATPVTPTIVTPAAEVPNGAGIGRAVEPREPEVGAAPVEAPVEKRDLAGFNAALSFATGALTTGPEVQLGTGEGGSGVGIIVNPKTGAAAAAPAAARPATE